MSSNVTSILPACNLLSFIILHLIFVSDRGARRTNTKTRTNRKRGETEGESVLVKMGFDLQNKNKAGRKNIGNGDSRCMKKWCFGDTAWYSQINNEFVVFKCHNSDIITTEQSHGSDYCRAARKPCCWFCKWHFKHIVFDVFAQCAACKTNRTTTSIFNNRNNWSHAAILIHLYCYLASIIQGSENVRE